MSDKLLAFDKSVTMTRKFLETQEHLYSYGGPRPEPEYIVRHSSWESSFKQDKEI